MRIRTSLLASVMLVGLGAAGQALAADATAVSGLGSSTASAVDDYSGDDRNNAGLAAAVGTANAAANNHSSATHTVGNAFNSNNSVATTSLAGAVSGNRQSNIGNLAQQLGASDGGNGGAGGGALGQAASVSASDGSGGSAESLALIGSAGASANGGVALATAGASGSGTGGDGGDGGDAGGNGNSAGSFDMSANMAAVANATAGVTVVAQNSGFTSLIQQGVTVQANLAVGASGSSSR